MYYFDMYHRAKKKKKENNKYKINKFKSKLYFSKFVFLENYQKLLKLSNVCDSMKI